MHINIGIKIIQNGVRNLEDKIREKEIEDNKEETEGQDQKKEDIVVGLHQEKSK